MRKLAQRITVDMEGQQVTLTGPLKVNTIGDVIKIFFKFFIPFVGFILVVTFIWAGYDLLTSGGDPEKFKSARAKITTAIVGVIILISAYVVAKLAAYIFNLGGGIF